MRERVRVSGITKLSTYRVCSKPKGFSDTNTLAYSSWTSVMQKKCFLRWLKVADREVGQQDVGQGRGDADLSVRQRKPGDHQHLHQGKSTNLAPRLCTSRQLLYWHFLNERLNKLGHKKSLEVVNWVFKGSIFKI